MHDVDLDWWVRNAGRADVAAILEVWRVSDASPSVTDTEADVLRAIEVCGDLFVVAEAEGVGVLGTLIAAWDGWRGNMYRLAVLPRYRRLGVGRGLVLEAESRLRERGCRRITALVEHAHPDAMGFWEALGYPVDGRIARRTKNL